MPNDINNTVPEQGRRIQLASGENSQIVIYTTSDGKVNLEVQIDANTVWLTQQQIAQLYGKAVSTINEHIKNILAEEELNVDECVKKFGNSEFQQKTPYYYNLSMIISVGYRVRSKQGTLFRQWATKRLEEYIVKGFTIDSERLKGNGGGQYWYELLNTIKDIRSSEKVLYRQVLDLYATSVDYNATDEETILFFKMVQNKLHYATHPSTGSGQALNIKYEPQWHISIF